MSTVTPLIDHVEDLWPDDGVPEDTLGQVVLASHLLGANRAVSNFGGGNTSAKGPATDHVGRDVTAMWVDLGSPEGAFEAAAAAVALLPQRPEIPVSEQARRTAFERLAGIGSVEQELVAALAARELLERLAQPTP